MLFYVLIFYSSLLVIAGVLVQATLFNSANWKSRNPFSLILRWSGVLSMYTFLEGSFPDPLFTYWQPLCRQVKWASRGGTFLSASVLRWVSFCLRELHSFPCSNSCCYQFSSLYSSWSFVIFASKNKGVLNN